MSRSRWAGPVKSTGGFEVGAVGTNTVVADASGNLYQAGTVVSASAAELNRLAGVTAGTATISKAVVLDASGKLDTLDITSPKIGGVTVTTTAAQLNTMFGTDRASLVKRVALAAVNTAGGVFAWTPAEDVLVHLVMLDVTTKATAACTVSVGVAANATTLSNILIDGLDVGTAAGLFDNITDKGTLGKSRQKCTSTQSVTGSVATGASSGIVGFAYIFYTRV